LATSALVIAGLALGSFSFRHGTPHARAAATAWAEDVMKFEPVPAESVTAMEHRRTERRERDTERRAAETDNHDVPAAPDKPDAPEPPEPPEAPEPPEFSHAGDVVRIGSDI